MYVQNFTNSDLLLNLKGNSIILVANEITTIPDGLVTEDDLYTFFGKGNIAVAESAGTTEASTMTSQQVLETGKLYTSMGAVRMGSPRLFVTGGTVDIYGSDSEEIPVSTSEMALPEMNEDVDGVRVFGALPRYIAIVGNATEVVITNCKLIEMGDIV